MEILTTRKNVKAMTEVPAKWIDHEQKKAPDPLFWHLRLARIGHRFLEPSDLAVVLGGLV